MVSSSIRLVPQKVQQEDYTERDLMLAPDNYFESIEVFDILEYSEEKQILDLICSKVRKNGKLKLSGVDGLQMCRSVFYGDVTLEAASENFFSKIKNLTALPVLRDFFIKNGWKIDFAGLKDGRYLIEATRK